MNLLKLYFKKMKLEIFLVTLIYMIVLLSLNENLLSTYIFIGILYCMIMLLMFVQFYFDHNLGLLIKNKDKMVDGYENLIKSYEDLILSFRSKEQEIVDAQNVIKTIRNTFKKG